MQYSDDSDADNYSNPLALVPSSKLAYDAPSSSKKSLSFPDNPFSSFQDNPFGHSRVKVGPLSGFYYKDELCWYLTVKVPCHKAQERYADMRRGRDLLH
jgi:hypothetical protein